MAATSTPEMYELVDQFDLAPGDAGVLLVQNQLASRARALCAEARALLGNVAS